MIKDFRGNEIKVGSKIAWVTYSNYNKANITMNTGKVLEIITENIVNWGKTGTQNILKVEREDNSKHRPKGKITKIAALNRVLVLPEETPLSAPFFYPSDETLKVDPFEIPKETTFGVDIGIVQNFDPFVIAREAIDKITPAQRRELTRELIKKSVNLGLKDSKDV